VEPVKIASVRLLTTAKATDKEFDYLCPGTQAVFPGAIVKIPFGKGNRERYGVAVRIKEEIPARALKPILSVLPAEISLNEEMTALCHYLKEHVFCSFGDAARAIIPSPVYKKSAKKQRFLSLCDGLDPEKALENFRGKNKEKYQELISYLSLTGISPEKKCAELFGINAAGFQMLSQKGILSFCEGEILRDPTDYFHRDVPDAAPARALSAEQEKAYLSLKEMMDEKKACAALLHGITGSGKTQVMLALCDYTLSLGKTVLFLVPEIALTGQSAALLTQRYKDRVAIIHSGLSEGERRDSYISISRGEKQIVLGTRSAVFAPVKNLGLILIDEEQDQSYKSDTQLKYHARDVARFRCVYHNAMLLLASATPDITSYHKAVTGKYRLITMNHRYGAAKLPQVRVVDLRPDIRKNPTRLIGSVLAEEIQKNLAQGEQTILLMNRRGYRNFVSCTDCGEVLRCPNCSVSLTVHNGTKKHLSCHYCGYATPLPQHCPNCQSDHLLSHGYGIQQLEEEIQVLFPDARVLRMDSDSLTGKNSHEAILSQFRKKEAEILIGTQMVAKGHNFPDVTLVGIVMADSALYLSDYRAGEHSFSLLTQVIGRAGRAEKEGRAVIQTLNPRHNIFSLASSQDYAAFYEGEIALRRSFQFPPFCNLGVFTLAAENEAALLSAAKDFSLHLSQLLSGEFSDVTCIVYGPFDAIVYRMKNVYRKRFILKYKDNPRTRAMFERLLIRCEEDKSPVQVTLDVNPGLI